MFAICVSLLVSSDLLPIFKFFVFLLSFEKSLYNLDTSPLSAIYVSQIFSLDLACPFTSETRF